MEDNVYRLSEQYNLYGEDFDDKKHFLFDVVEGSIFNLNEISYIMLSLFDGKRSVGEILSRLMEIYEIDESTLREDFSSLLDQWTNEKILILIKEGVKNGQ